MTGWFVAPNSEDDDTYIRYSQETTLKGARRFAIGGGALQPMVISNSQGPFLTLHSADTTVDTTTLPDGHYVATAGNCYPLDFVVQNGANPVRGPLVPLVQANMDDEKAFGSFGVAWVPYSDPPPLPAGNRIKPRVQLPLDKYPGDRNQFWMRPLTRSNGTYSALKEWRADQFGNVHIGHYQQYNRTVVQSSRVGNMRDGLYGRAGVGTPVCLREMADGSVLVTSINAGVKLIRPDLSVETVWGKRLKADKPIPSVTYGSGEIDDAQFDAHRNSHYEYVGDTLPVNPWCAIPDPVNTSVIWIANTDAHHVLKYDIVQKKTLAIIGSPTGVLGRADGIGTAVLMRRPRGLSFGPDGLLYVAQAWNHSIGTIDPITLEYKERLRSVNNWDTYPAGNTKGTNFYGQTVDQLRAFWDKDGGPGVASFHHPQQCDFASDGKLIFGCDHTRVVIEYDPVANTVRKLINLPSGSFGGADVYRHQAWISLAVNRNGVGVCKDLIAYADWDIESLNVYKRDGTLAFPVITDAVDSGTRFGRLNRVSNPGYPWAVGWGKDRYLWGDSGSECIQELSLRQPSDVDYSSAAVKAGKLAWQTPNGGLSMAGIYDDFGFSQLGDPQFQDMQPWTEAQIDAWLSAKRPDWNATTLANVRTYIRYSQQEPGGAPPPPPPPPPPPSEPTVAELQAKINAAIAALQG